MERGSNLTKREKELKALANKRRLLLLTHLNRNKELHVGELADRINLSFTATSRHLYVLYSANLIGREQKNLNVYYHIKKPATSLLRAAIDTL